MSGNEAETKARRLDDIMLLIPLPPPDSHAVGRKPIERNGIDKGTKKSVLVRAVIRSFPILDIAPRMLKWYILL